MTTPQSPAKKQSNEARISATESKLAACESRIAVLEDKLRAIEQTRTRVDTTDSLVVCLIDGDGCIFNKELIEGGHKGGRSAAIELKQCIFNHHGKNCVVLVNIFLKGYGFKNTVRKHFKIEAKTVEAFIEGFNTLPYMSMVDVGGSKEAADKKIRELMWIFAHDPHAERIYFGGGHDGGYSFALAEVEEKGYLGKITILQGYTEIAPGIAAFNLPCLKNEGLFLMNKLPYYAQGTHSNTTSPVFQTISLPLENDVEGQSGPSSSLVW